MFPTPYSELNQVTPVLVSRVQGILDNAFVGAYLQGSFAIGDYDLHSDVDFIVVVDDELPGDLIGALQEMHDQIYQLDSEWAQHLEGSYFPREVLRHHSKQGMELWYLVHGARSLIRSDHCNTIVVRWVVREKGVTLEGPAPNTLVDPISDELLRADIYETITHWGRQILDDPAPFHNWFYLMGWSH